MDDVGDIAWCLADVEVSSAKTKACDCKKKERKNVFNKAGIIKENKVI